MKNVRCLLPALAVSALLFSGVHSVAQGATNPPLGSVPAASPAARPTQSELQWRQSVRAAEWAQVRDGREVSEEILTEKQIVALVPAKFDRDGNGRFNETEFNAWTSAMRSAIVDSPTAMKRFDANKNGKLDDREWQAVVGQLVNKS